MRLVRVAIVTGGSRGIGREVARDLAGQGCAVIVDYARNQRDAAAVVEEILAANGTALTVRADVADELDVERLFTETAEAFGGVDVVVHAAAGQVTPGPVVDFDPDTFDALLRTNVRGTFVVNQQAARHLRDGGAIVNLSSPIVRLADPGNRSPRSAILTATAGCSRRSRRGCPAVSTRRRLPSRRRTIWRARFGARRPPTASTRSARARQTRTGPTGTPSTWWRSGRARNRPRERPRRDRRVAFPQGSGTGAKEAPPRRSWSCRTDASA